MDIKHLIICYLLFRTFEFGYTVIIKLIIKYNQSIVSFYLTAFYLSFNEVV